MLKLSRSAAAIVAVVVLLASAMANDAERTAADVLGGDDIIKVIRDAKKVEVYRLKAQSIQRTPDEYVATAGPLVVDAKVATELAAVLTHFDSYERELAVGCEPQFGMRTTFTSANTKVDVVYCFDCDTLVVYRDGKKAGDALFIPAHKRLVALAKRMLLKDEVIQGLK